MSKKIPLTQGKFALVDDVDYEWLNQWKWYAMKRDSLIYARITTARSVVLMHRIILGLQKGDKICSDHIDGDGLNNQRSNLRICTNQQNICNQRIRRENGKSSKYKGVYREKGGNVFRANIKVFGKTIHLSRFMSEIEAAKAYNKAAIQYFGEFAKLNELSEQEVQ